jgi:hypothetical protein
MYENINLKRGFIYGVGFTIKQGFICQLIRYMMSSPKSEWSCYKFNVVAKLVDSGEEETSGWGYADHVLEINLLRVIYSGPLPIESTPPDSPQSFNPSTKPSFSPPSSPFSSP